MGGMEETEKEDETIIPEEDFREAIAACCLDPLLKRYFRLAPPGAKLFIGLGFYSTHFGDRVDPKQYVECQAEIEPALTVNDLKYLIRFENDRNTKQYLQRLLIQRQEEGAPSEPPPETPPPIQQDETISLPRRRRRKRNTVPALQWMMHRESVRWVPLLCKAAALAVLLLGSALLLYIKWDRLTDERANGTALIPNMAETSVSPPPAATPPPPTAAKDDASPPASPLAFLPPGTETQEKDSLPQPTPPSPVKMTLHSPAETNLAMVTASPIRKKIVRTPRVIFTDGRKIIRHTGGKIEVPRVFSCIGAGIKPFWVYGPNPEREAAKERKARHEWRQLADQAKLNE